jgi:hypothetical protein
LLALTGGTPAEVGRGPATPSGPTSSGEQPEEMSAR